VRAYCTPVRTSRCMHPSGRNAEQDCAAVEVPARTGCCASNRHQRPHDTRPWRANFDWLRLQPHGGPCAGRARTQRRIQMQERFQRFAMGGDCLRAIRTAGGLSVALAFPTPKLRAPGAHPGLAAFSAETVQRHGCTPHGRDAPRGWAQPDSRVGEAAGRAVAAWYAFGSNSGITSGHQSCAHRRTVKTLITTNAPFRCT
jgi:hypothetical protein